MRTLLVLLVLLAGFCLAGCGLVDTYAEREHRYNTIIELNARQMVDDWDYFWFAERPSSLTYWYLQSTR